MPRAKEIERTLDLSQTGTGYRVGLLQGKRFVRTKQFKTKKEAIKYARKLKPRATHVSSEYMIHTRGYPTKTRNRKISSRPSFGLFR